MQGAPYGTGRYRAMPCCRPLRLDALRPSPTPAAPSLLQPRYGASGISPPCGVRVPEVLVAQENGFAMRHLVAWVNKLLQWTAHGVVRYAQTTLLTYLAMAAGLTLTHTHRQGTCLSQRLHATCVRPKRRSNLYRL